MSAHGHAVAEAWGEEVEVARYTVRDGERIICAERIDRFVHITDRPARAPGRCYFIERCLASDGSSSVQALVADYTRRASRLQQIPMLAGAPTDIDQVPLARYRCSGGERILYGQRVNGVVRVTDRPASGPGRSYLVERGVESEGYGALRALVADYVREADRLDDIPMARSQVRRIVEQPPAGRRPQSPDGPPATRCPRSPAGPPVRRCSPRRPAWS